MKTIKNYILKIFLIIACAYAYPIFSSNAIEGSLLEIFIEKNAVIFDFYIHEEFLKNISGLSFLKKTNDIFHEIESKKELVYNEIKNLFSIILNKNQCNFNVIKFSKQKPYYIVFRLQLSEFNYDKFENMDIHYLYPLSLDKKDNLCLIINDHVKKPFTTDINYLHGTRKGLCIQKDKIKNYDIDFINYRSLYIKIILYLLVFFIILLLPPLK